MKFYIGARFTQKDVVRRIYSHLKSKGHEITHDWTTHKNLMSFENNEAEVSGYASHDIDGIKNADIVIVLTENSKGSQGMHTELGAAIAFKSEHKKPDIFVVGRNNNTSIFFFHPLVKRRNTAEEVFEELNI